MNDMSREEMNEWFESMNPSKLEVEKAQALRGEQRLETASAVETIVNCRTTHELKTLPEYFERILSGEKNFEVRKNDRGFQKGDRVVLKEYEASKITTLDRHKYTGREIYADIGFVLSEYQKQGYVTFSLLNIECN